MFRALILSTAMLAASAAIIPASAAEGDWLVRFRVINVDPSGDVGTVNPGFPTGSVSVDNAIVPEVDFTRFFSDHWAAELILATSPHDISGVGSLNGLGKIAETMALPPTITLQYHFAPEASFRPYIGAGLNYTMFYNEDTTTSLVGALGPTSIDLDDSFGFALQAGFDVDINEKWFFNADIKYIDIDTEATLNSNGTINTVKVDLDPVVAGIGVGFRF